MKTSRITPTRATSTQGHGPRSSPGFTVVELILVIVVIAILATIAVIGYGAFLNRAGEVVLKSDLQTGASTLERDRLHGGGYPNRDGDADGGRGLPKSDGTTLGYYKTASAYCLEATSDRTGVPQFHIAGKNPEKILDGPCVMQVSVVAGSATGASGNVDGTGGAARFNRPHGVAVDHLGNLYVADSGNNTIRKITPAGMTTTLAGGSGYGYLDGAAGTARFYGPHAVDVDSTGNVYVADRGNSAIRKISPSGFTTTLAGSPTKGFADGTGSAAQFNEPSGIAVADDGTVYVTDTSNHRIRKITSSGVVTTIAGAGTAGFADGAGMSARFNNPWEIAVDHDGTLFVADADNHRIRKITSDGIVTTLAGDGTWGFADGPGLEAKFTNMHGLDVDLDGNVYVSDVNNNRLRRVSSDGTVTTPAGTGEAGNEIGDPSSAQFYNPHGVAVSTTGAIFVADTDGHRICRLEASDEL